MTAAQTRTPTPLGVPHPGPVRAVTGPDQISRVLRMARHSAVPTPEPLQPLPGPAPGRDRRSLRSRDARARPPLRPAPARLGRRGLGTCLPGRRRPGARARREVDKRGGVDALKEDMSELQGIAKQKGSMGDKAKAAGEAIRIRERPVRTSRIPAASPSGRRLQPSRVVAARIALCHFQG